MEHKREKNVFLTDDQVSLLSAQAFNRYYRQDRWGFLRPEFSGDLARLSAEFALSTYDFEMEQWAEAGWVDFTFQIDNKVYSVDNSIFLDEEGEEEKESLRTYEKAVAQTRQKNLGKQLFDVARQMESSDTGKVVLMGRKIEHGKYVIGIGFMGTGKRAYDWFSNFRFGEEEGAHQGFMQLTRQYMSHQKDIQFPEIAQDLGLEKLTLTDIIKESKNADSRFLLWMTGHSQGAAIMQLWTYLLAKEEDIRLSNVIGYGFASPLVMMGTTVDTPAKYPLYHVLNSEDVVQKVGGQIRLGVDLPYIATPQLREKSYGWRKDEKAQNERELVQGWLNMMVDMPTALENLIVFLDVFFDGSAEDIMMRIRLLPLPLVNSKMITGILHKRTDGVFRFLKRRIEKAYISMTNVTFDNAHLVQLSDQLHEIIEEIGLDNTVAALNELLYWPHILYPSNNMGTSSYLEIVKDSDKIFSAAIWEKGNPPKRKWGMYDRNNRETSEWR